MADLAIGISKTAVDTLVNKFHEAVQEENELLETAVRDFVFIQNEFEMMQSFFSTVDGERIKTNVGRTWVRQVIDQSYDAEDLIDTVRHLDINRSRWRAYLLRMMRNYFTYCGFSGAVQPLDDAIAKIMLLKARVEEVRQRNMRYNLTSGSCTEPVMEMKQAAAGNTRKSAVLVKGNDASKARRRFLSLTWLINKEEKGLQVISVWGTEDDVGVTATIKEAYEDEGICRKFRCAWVRLMHPFNSLQFMQRVLAQFYTNPRQGQGRVDADVLAARVLVTQGDGDLITEFVRQVNEQRYLIVLEGISSMEQWYSVKTYLPDVSNGSRIVLSTQHLDIARSCTGHQHQALEHKQFSDNHSVWVLKKRDPFRKKAFVGRGSEVNDLFNKTRAPGIYVVWGLPGVGKSALVKSMYDRCKSEKPPRYSKYAWVSVSQPFDIEGFRQSISNMLSGPHPSCNPMEECRRLLDEEGLLLIIDGLRSNKDWDSINTNLIREPASGNRKNCIIVTTSEQVVTSGSVRYFYVSSLQEDAALDLFNQKLWETATILRMDMIVQEAKHFFSACSGLPRVIIAIAEHLGNLFREDRVTREQEWRCLCANIGLLETSRMPDDDLPKMFDRMHSSFNTCPQLLKKFIFYLTVFPRWTIIRVRCLIRRWAAEGCFKGTDSLEAEAEEIIRKLEDIGVIRATTMDADMRMTSCQIDPFFFGYFLSRLKEESIVRPLEVFVLEKRYRSINTGHVGLHLTIRDKWEADTFVFDELDVSHLRSLTVFQKWESFFSERMEVLRVLDLEDATDVDLSNIGKLPSRLKFLSLRGCKSVSSLPDSLKLCELTQLQTLDIRGTAIEKLPKCIINLRELLYISAGPLQRVDDDDGVEVPKGIRHLKGLKTLGNVNVNAAGGKAILKDICSLRQMRKLKLSGINRRNSRTLRSALRCFPDLESLSLRHVEDLPCGIGDLGKLTKLILDMTAVLTLDVIRDLGSLQNLRTLRLGITRSEHGVLQFPTAENLFGELRSLEITCVSVIHISFGIGVMKNLEVLVVHCSDRPSIHFSGKEYLPSLKQFWHHGSSDVSVTTHPQKHCSSNYTTFRRNLL